jgi:predicted enzyme related to lactoylglutathione lyase
MSRIANKPAWLDLSSHDAEGSRNFYSQVFGWNVEVNPDPQYGGYGIAKVDGKDVAGISPAQSADSPTAWSIYIGTDDVDATTAKAGAAGGTVILPALEVPGQGRMAVYQDPSGAFISVWQAYNMGGFQTNGANTFGWAELNAHNVEGALSFYQQVFGWTAKKSDMGEGAPPYTEFQLEGSSVAGAQELNPAQAQVPSHWLAYFTVDDVDASCQKAAGLGATVMVAPMDFPGGRFAILGDPQGAMFGLLKQG